MIKRRRLTALACATSLLLVGAARASRPLRVTLVNPGRSDEVFWIMTEKTMRAAALGLSIELEVLHANRDRLQMRDLGLSVVSRATLPDALVIANEEQSAHEILLAAAPKRLPTLLLVTDLQGAEAEEIGAPGNQISSYLGSLAPDNLRGGQLLAELTIGAARQLPRRPPGPIHLLAIGGDQVTSSARDRLEGLQTALRKSPDIVLDRTLFADWSEAEAKALTERYIAWARRGDLRPSAVWGMNDAIALGAVAAFNEAGYEAGQNVAFGGINWSRDGIQAVIDRKMAVTIGGHFFCGAWAMVMLRDYFDGHDFSQAGTTRLRVPLLPLDARSAPAYLAAFGTENWSRIDFRRFCRGTTGKAEYDFSLDAVLAATTAS
jgi:ABC-type sugar transport system substrate-binding protein